MPWCDMEKIMKNKVRLNIVLEVDVSDDYLQKLKDNLFLEIVKNCFKNNSRKIISETMEVLENV
jgi:hypothetical protein